ncbi:unnamed protein product (macronuclear) [Paramecium tetraurelia]|uniref:Uncharacterized protein n=1 Tax=Paramecium tetraurelia TaxID=5888 RepID=A0E929_PARTE|nr:uncharacterized protein GSPATT00024527001 [Paramecium tetraurelia]CAK91796.1 unnamed protein product [Paramecium tetraurelia]|eukprot:XP_001459193.1 hypothetical protein (macronuclear) [Paramecium tetraurelia strain d4-2]
MAQLDINKKKTNEFTYTEILEENNMLKRKLQDLVKQIKQFEQESKGLQYENEILQKCLAQQKNNTQQEQKNKQVEDQIAQLQAIHQREKEYWIRDQQEQVNRIKQVQEQTKRILQDKIDHLEKENEFLQMELENNKTIIENYEFQIEQIQQNHKAESSNLQRELKQKQYSIDELKFQIQEQGMISQRSNNNQELLNKLKEAIDELNKCKKIISNQQYEIQLQCRLFDELRQDYQKKLCKERSKSQMSFKAAQEVKNEYEKKYCNLMEQIIKNQTSRSCNASFKLLPSSMDQTMNNDFSRISNNQSNNIGGLSAINKALSDSIDDYEKSILNNISGNVTKRKPSKSEWEKKQKGQQNIMISVTPENQMRPQSQQQEIFSPKISQKRAQSIHSSKGIKQYTFNLCEYNESRNSNDSDQFYSQCTQQTRQSKLTLKPQKSNNDVKRNSKHQKSLSTYRSVKDKENLQFTIPEENQKINSINTSKQLQILEDKNERLDTNTKFNSLLKVI